MLKKMVACLLCTLCLMPFKGLAQETDGKIALLQSLGIFEGYEDGSYRLENHLTRAEFTKVSVKASENRKAVSASFAVSPFADVPHTLWSAPYIHLAAKSGYVTGYLDSTFRPDAPITYAEATAVFLRLLGYQNSDFGAAWPQGHMMIAEDLGLCDGITLDYNAPITRGDTVTLLYNLLDENKKGTQTEYLSLLECSSQENVIIRATSREDGTIAQSKVLTSAGTFKKGDNFDADWVGRKGELFIKDGDTVAAFVPNVQSSRSFTVTGTAGENLLLDDTIYNWNSAMPVYYKSDALTYKTAHSEATSGATFTLFYDEDGAAEYGLLYRAQKADAAALTVKTVAVYSVLSDGIIAYKNGQMEKVTLDDGVTLYEGDTLAGTLSKSRLQMGDLLKIVYDEDEDVDYVILDTNGVKGPYTVQNAAWTSQFPITAATAVMRDGKKVSTGDVETYDILYYSEALNMILAYTDRITGVYKSASPTKDTPTSVNISGTDYPVEGLEAFHKLATGGAFSFGDTVTLLLGRGGAVCDVLTPGASSEVCGVVTNTGTKQYETTLGESYSGYTLSITNARGETFAFEADRDYDTLLNQVVSLSFSDGKAAAKLRDSDTVSGKVDASAFTIESHVLSPQVKILETYAPDAYTPGSCGTVFLQRLDGITLSSKDVLFAGRDSQNRITELILGDITGDLHKYGVVSLAKSASFGMSVSGSYQYVIDGSAGTHQTNGSSFSVYSGMPAKFTYSGGRIYSIQKLTELSGAVKTLTDSTLIYTDGTRYDISAADIYTKDSDNVYIERKAADISTETYTLRAYYDKAPSSGGKIRIILATKK